MAVLSRRWRAVAAERLQVVSGDSVTRVVPERALEAAPRFGRVAETRDGNSEIRPGWGVPRIQANCAPKLLLRECVATLPQEKRPVVEPNARHARGVFDRALEHRLRAVRVAGLREPDRQVVHVVRGKRVGSDAGIACTIGAEPLPRLRHGQLGASLEQFERVIGIRRRAHNDVSREYDGFHWHADALGEGEGDGGQRCAVPFVRRQYRRHRRRLRVARVFDRRELPGTEKRVDDAASTILAESGSRCAWRCRVGEPVELSACCGLLGRVGKLRIHSEKSSKQSALCRAASSRRECPTAAERGHQSESTCLSSESEAERGVHANE